MADVAAVGVDGIPDGAREPAAAEELAHAAPGNIRTTAEEDVRVGSVLEYAIAVGLYRAQAVAARGHSTTDDAAAATSSSTSASFIASMAIVVDPAAMK